MARINTPFQQNNVAPDLSGEGTFWPWVLDLRTLAGYKGFDVAVAANFRITSWHLEGRMQAVVLGVEKEDLFDEVIPAALSGGDILFGNEYDFCAKGTVEEDGIPRNARLRTDVAKFVDLTQILITGQTAFVRFDFRRSGPNTGLTVLSTGDGSSNAPEVGDIVVRVPAWIGTGWHTLTTTLYNDGALPGSTNPRVTFTLTGTASRLYADAAGAVVWNGNGSPAQDPVTAVA